MRVSGKESFKHFKKGFASCGVKNYNLLLTVMNLSSVIIFLLTQFGYMYVVHRVRDLNIFVVSVLS